MSTVLIGNYGVGNLGDEALREYFLRAFPHVHFQVVSAHPVQGELPRLPGGIRSFLTTSWWKTVMAIRRSDAVVFGGGTLFTDIESSYACMLWALHVFVARLFRKPVLHVFQGIGPFVTRRGAWLAHRAVAAASFISVRDAVSKTRVESWRMNKNVIQSFDPVYKEIHSKNTLGTKNILNVIPRENSSQSFLDAAVRHWRSGTWDDVRILSLAPASSLEIACCAALTRLIPDSVVYPVSSMGQLTEFIAGSAFVLTERYHGAVAALALEVPFAVVSQGKDDKLAAIDAIAHGAEKQSLGALVQCGEDALRDALRYHARSLF